MNSLVPIQPGCLVGIFAVFLAGESLRAHRTGKSEKSARRVEKRAATFSSHAQIQAADATVVTQNADSVAQVGKASPLFFRQGFSGSSDPG